MLRFLTMAGVVSMTAGAISATAAAHPGPTPVSHRETSATAAAHPAPTPVSHRGTSATAAARAAHPVVYRGRTRDGDPISFTLVGARLTHLSAYVPTVCLATDGLPLSGTDPFDPPGAFRLGGWRAVKAKRPNAIWNTSDVTKNFKVTARHGRGGRISGKLHVDYSFLEILYTYPISSRPYVCSGDTAFQLKPRS
jgi:hypothetical protein